MREIRKIIFIYLVIFLSFNYYGYGSINDKHRIMLNESPRYQNTNVIFISIDTLRYDHLGCYGYSRKTSKNIDRFAKRSVIFENFISQAYLTPISQMSIFTSQYPRTNGLIQFEVAEEEVSSRTLPTILKYYDYTNAAFLSSPEFYFQVQLKESGALLQTKSIFEKSFDIFKATAKSREVPEEALEWIENNKNKKFFLWIAIGTVHWPYALNVPEPYKSMFDPKHYYPFFLRYEGAKKEYKDYLPLSILSHIYQNDYYVKFSPIHHLTEEDIQYIISRYDAGIFYMDMFIGKLLSVLDKCNLMDKTIIILHSIHGEDLGEHGYFHHYDIYDTEVKNALIIKFPKDKFKGKKISFQIQGIDIMPTLLDYLNIPITHEAQGNSLMPLIEYNKSNGLSEFAYITRIPLWEFLLGRWLLEYIHQYPKKYYFITMEEILKYRDMLRQYFGVYPQYQYPPYDIAIRTKDWKLILRRHKSLLEKISWWSFISKKKIYVEEVELYNLKNDPLEQKNIVTEHPDIVEKLKKKLLEWDDYIEKRRVKMIENINRSIIPYP